MRVLPHILAAVLLTASTTWAVSPRPNVLFISTDDLNTDLGCYGRSVVKTPNIDRLAARGVRFELAYCQYPLCNPSRVSMLTGVRPDTARVYDLETNFRTTMPDAVTLPQLFRQNGYFTARVGKIFHYGVPRQIGTAGMDDPVSWDVTFNPIGRDKTEEKELRVLTRGTGTTLGFAMAWRQMPGTDDQETDGIGVTETIKLLEQSAKTLDKPFFIAMGFYRPHTPFVATKKWFDLYPREQIKLPVFDPDDLKDVPEAALMIRLPNYGLAEDDLIDCVRGYRASVSCLDAQVGELLAALERLKLADNTIIVFFSDHGFLLGQHGQWQKQLLFDPSARVPLIVYAPGAQGNGKSCAGPVELLDVYPTLKELCGLPDPSQKLQGQSLAGLLNDPSAAPDRPVFSQVTRRIGKGASAEQVMAYSVRTRRWRYTQWGKLGRELYDMAGDPDEIHNLGEDAAHAQTITEMQKLLGAIK